MPLVGPAALHLLELDGANVPDIDHEQMTARPAGAGSNWYVLVIGLPTPDADVVLADGVTLRPVASQLSVFDLAALGGAGFREWAVLEPIAPAATCEIETAHDAAVVPGYDALNRAWLAAALLVLRGYTGLLTPACCSYSWNRVAGHQERTSHMFQQQLAKEGVDAAVLESQRALPTFSGGILDYHLRVIATQSPRHDRLDDSDIAWFAKHFEVFNDLAGNNEAFRFALAAAVDWRYSTDRRSALARIWAGIEALLGVSSELVFRISVYAAAVPEPRGEARRRRFTAVKKLYAARSKAVHGDAIDHAALASTLDESFGLLSDLLRHVAEQGRPLTNDDFDRAVFG